MYTIIGSDGQQYGPSDFATVQQWIQSGQANAQTQVFKEGSPNWVPLSTLPEFAGMLGGAPAMPTAPGMPAAQPLPGMPVAGARPGAPKVLGILNIIFGGAGVLCAPCVMIGSLALASFMAGGEGIANAAAEDNAAGSFAWLKWFFIFTGVMFTVTASLMLAGGIGLVKYRNWGRKLSITVAILTCVMALVDVATTFAIIKPAFDKMSSSGDHAVGGVGFLIGKLVQITYPIVLLVLLNKPNVKQSMT